MTFARPFALGIFLTLGSCAGATAEDILADAPVALEDGGLGVPGLPGLDGPAPDANGPDATDATDAPTMAPDAPIGCTLPGGRTGICIDVAACTAMVGHIASPGFCPGPVNIQCCSVAPQMTACDPTEIPEPNVGLVEELGDGGCPAGMLRVESEAGGFCIDRFEAALVVVSLDDGTVSPWSPYFNPGGQRVVARSLRGAVPQGYMTQLQAAAACAEAGKRLCTDTEWLRACRGPQGWIFPYGNTRETGVCNDHRSEHPAVELFGSVKNLTSPCLNELHDTVDRTGSRKDCVTIESTPESASGDSEGAYDMMGNLHEWTADEGGTFRGGFYVDTVENGPGCLYVTTAHSTSYDDYSTGFRCCAE